MARYSKRFRSRLKALQIGVRHYPSISHPELVKWQVDQQRPFQARGTGYRDALIWHSLLELLKGSKDDCVLVTKNSADFSASREFTTILHSELQKHLDPFLDEHAKATLKKLDDLKKELENGKPTDLKHELKSRFQQILEGINNNTTRLLKLKRYDLQRLAEPIEISSIDEKPTELHLDDVWNSWVRVFIWNSQPSTKPS